MKPIKITDAAAVTAALLAVNGKATAHTYTHAHQLAKIAEEAEAELEALSIPKKHRAGARYTAQSGSRLANAYKHGAITTCVTLLRNSAGWRVEKISQATLYPGQSPQPILVLTAPQDAIAVANFRRCYAVSSTFADDRAAYAADRAAYAADLARITKPDLQRIDTGDGAENLLQD
jgi:hypothetical protein